MFGFLQNRIYHALIGGARNTILRSPPSRFSLGLRKSVANLRWKLFRLVSLATMGRLGGEAYLGNKIVFDLAENRPNLNVRPHIIRLVKLDDAYVQRYAFSSSFPESFSLNVPFGDQYAFLLLDVCISPVMGAMWFPDGSLLLQSVIRTNFFYSFGGAVETLMPTVESNVKCPICPLSFSSCYYHQLFEGLLPALRARQHFPETKFLVPISRPAFFDSMAAFFGITRDSYVESAFPVHVAQGVLIAKRQASGSVRQSDVDYIRSECEKHLQDVGYGRKIYISRSMAAWRKVQNESDFEHELAAIGFEICHFEAMSFPAQMETIHAASIVVAPHGSGEANMIAARKGTKWVEILQDNWVNTCYARLAIQCGLNYSYFMMVRKGNDQLIPVRAIASWLNEHNG